MESLWIIIVFSWAGLKCAKMEDSNMEDQSSAIEHGEGLGFREAVNEVTIGRLLRARARTAASSVSDWGG
jgi:hypothetical protein